jgi:hypothetical protein
MLLIYLSFWLYQEGTVVKLGLLIYMSIRAEINYWLDPARQELFEVAPTVPGDPLERFMFASRDVNRLISGPWADVTEEYRCGRLWAATDMFVTGALITMALDDPYKKPKTTYMARLDPPRDEVWEVRVLDPKPGIRVFGRFAECDAFVALTWAPREALPNSQEWRDAREGCKVEWRKLFPTYNAVTGDSVNEYVSVNAVPV